MNNKSFFSVATLSLLFLTVYIGILIANGIEERKYLSGETRTIVISAEGESFAKPDIASIQLSIRSEKETVDKAMEENTNKTDKVIDFLKKEGIEEKDIKTISFNIYPLYRYDKGMEGYISGYEVLHSLEVKIREIGKTGEIIAGATKEGINQAGNLIFSVEKEEELREMAREEAIIKAKEEAEKIASQLDVKVKRIVSFSETTDKLNMPFYRDNMNFGMGGGPEIGFGENRIVSNVSIVFEIR
ncbi:MAG: SIMPL domain-containing protein [Candidatus Pacebacteria bacterium]|nr:SIMPL domain-containing protein [Candidatus Paceibacterota bacterium]